MSADKIMLSKKELDNLIQTEINKQKIDGIGKAFKAHMLAEEVNWSKVFDKLDDVPKTLQRCRNEIENDMKENFQSKKDAELMETKLESKIDLLKSKITWSVGIVTAVIVSIGGVVQYFLNIYIKVGVIQ